MDEVTAVSPSTEFWQTGDDRGDTVQPLLNEDMLIAGHLVDTGRQSVADPALQEVLAQVEELQAEMERRHVGPVVGPTVGHGSLSSGSVVPGIRSFEGCIGDSLVSSSTWVGVPTTSTTTYFDGVLRQASAAEDFQQLAPPSSGDAVSWSGAGSTVIGLNRGVSMDARWTSVSVRADGQDDHVSPSQLFGTTSRGEVRRNSVMTAMSTVSSSGSECDQSGNSTLTPEEFRRKERRREQNRRAALKCRSRRKQEANELAKNYKEMLSKTEQYKGEIARMKENITKLEKQLSQHSPFCRLQHPTSSRTSFPSST